MGLIQVVNISRHSRYMGMIRYKLTSVFLECCAISCIVCLECNGFHIFILCTIYMDFLYS